MLNNKVPNRLWDYGFIWISETGNLSVQVRDMYQVEHLWSEFREIPLISAST